MLNRQKWKVGVTDSDPSEIRPHGNQQVLMLDSIWKFGDIAQDMFLFLPKPANCLIIFAIHVLAHYYPYSLVNQIFLIKSLCSNFVF